MRNSRAVQIRMAAAWLAFLVPLGCGERPSVVQHSPPAGTQSILLFSIDGNGTSTRVNGLAAFAYADSGNQEVPIVVPKPFARPHIAYYSQSLEALGLVEGNNEIVRDPCGSRIIPAPLGVRTFVDEELIDVPARDVPPQLRAVRFPAPSGVQVRNGVRTMVVTDQVAPLVRLDRSVYIQEENVVYSFHLDDALGPIPASAITPLPLGNDYLVNYYEHPSGLSFVGTAASRIYCGTWETGFRRINLFGPGGRIVALTGPKDTTEPFEVFVGARGQSDGVGASYRLTASTPTCAVTLESLDDGLFEVTKNDGRIERIGPGDAIVVTENGEAYRWQEDLARVRFLTDFPIRSVAYLGNGRVMLAARGINGMSPLAYGIYDVDTGQALDLVQREDVLVDTQHVFATGAESVVVVGTRLSPVFEFRPEPRPLEGHDFTCPLNTPLLKSDEIRDLFSTSREVVVAGSERQFEGQPARDLEIVTIELTEPPAPR